MYLISIFYVRSSTPPESGWRIVGPGIEPLPTVLKVHDMEVEPDCLASFRNMLLSVKFSDIHFHCLDGTILHAHRNILFAASPYFAIVFEDPWGDDHPNGVWNTADPVDQFTMFKVTERFLMEQIEVGNVKELFHLCCIL
uniref:BTB domain-containing protein n=1 Tax=Eucampia antarctica TaxID=49252 RepID=A0A7S2WE13_9STRA|mmetsp:Transcript_27637/g.26505  ORF Transcript_27637/g.26505 Transcript_27637/m.26505 type:complete len:140 (+) Transcript_27637:114-533(+)